MIRLPLTLAIGVFAMICGCDGQSAGRSDESTNPDRPTQTVALQRVMALGTLEPRGGILAVMAAPGDRVAKIFVDSGQDVTAGTVLMELESLPARQLELTIAQTKLDEARRRIAAERAAGEAKLQVARSSLKQAESKLKDAQKRFKDSKADGGELNLLKQAADLGLRRLRQLETASRDPARQRLVSENALDTEALKVSESQARYESALRDAEEAIDEGQFGVDSAEQEIRATELSLIAAEQSASLESLKQQIELLKFNVATSRLVAPTKGRVLRVDATIGTATGVSALMHLADTTQMVCVAEVNVADLSRVEIGQTAIITSPALRDPLHGKVQRIHSLIAPPTLASPYPMAAVDRYSADVVIAIDAGDAESASHLIELQVDVEIQAGRSAKSAEVASAAKP
ncbi:ABC exporter membrane fusion protein [Rhodopirellula islandica]|nr:ABC exporter membrane fusion protein [Rhodopirellula islandica]